MTEDMSPPEKSLREWVDKFETMNAGTPLAAMSWAAKEIDALRDRLTRLTTPLTPEARTEAEEGLRFLARVSDPADAPMALWAIQEIDKLRAWVSDRDERLATLEDELAEAKAPAESGVFLPQDQADALREFFEDTAEHYGNELREQAAKTLGVD